MKRIIIIFFLLICNSLLFAKEYKLDELLTIFERNSTSEAKKEYFKKINEYELENLSKEYYPKLNLLGQIQYQSETFELPIHIPTFTLPKIPLDQYYSAIEFEQLIFDGLAISKSKDLSNEKAIINDFSSEVDKQKLKETITSLFFNIIALNKQKSIISTAIDDLKNKLKLLNSMLSNGVLLKSSVNQLEVEIIRRNEDLIKTDYDIKKIKKALAILCGLSDDNFDLTQPINLDEIKITDESRPEIKLFQANSQALELNKSLINSNYLPKLSAFAKFGYANPNPNNFMKTEFSTFYNVGIRLKWEIFDWNKNYNSKQIISQNQEILKLDEENFNRNFKIAINEEQNNILKYEKNIESELKVKILQENILQEANSQLNNGLITMSEYLSHYNNLERTNLTIEMYKILKLQAIYNIYIKTNHSIN
jgi:outer membrane protein TolC